MRVGVCGAGGRMGRMLIATACDWDEIILSGASECDGHPLLGTDAGVVAGVGELHVPIVRNVDAMLSAVDVCIDFTHPSAAVSTAEQCGQAGKPIVIGTTGFDDGQKAELRRISTQIAMVVAPNMSVGVNVCFKLLAMAASILGDDVDIEIIEAHHRHKVDAPSGTALKMGEVIARTLQRDLETCAVYGREGQTGERERRTIGFESVRGGDIVGEHTVLFAGTGERIEITHRASSRSNFAHGALRAAGWLRNKSSGIYDMQDVLGLS